MNAKVSHQFNRVKAEANGQMFFSLGWVLRLDRLAHLAS